MKTVLVIFDGLGDRPIKELGNKTPLEAADTPNLDEIASKSECGIMCSLGRGRRPGSDTSHFAILGCDPDRYYPGRGPIEVAGLGIDLTDGDVAFRGNFGTVDSNWIIKDRRAGRILDVSLFAAALDNIEVEDIKVIVKPGTAHRAGVVFRGAGLDPGITDADPHEPGLPVYRIEPKNSSEKAAKTARIINAFMAKAYDILKNMPENKEREDKGLLPANFLLLRGAGQYKKIEPFSDKYGMSSCCIAGGGLYKGVGALMGMKQIEVPGATGLFDTDISAKFQYAKDALSNFDFIFVHVKASDSMGEDGNFTGKKSFIEKIDLAAKKLVDLPEDTLLVITADHSTPCMLKQHSADPVPLIFCGPGVRTDSVKEFGERTCATGINGFFNGLDIIPHILNLSGKLPLIGA